MPLETIHIVVSLGVLLVTGIVAFVSIKGKLEAANGRAEIMQTINNGRVDIMQTTSIISGKLDTHIQLDKVKHEQIDKHLESTDERVDRLERPQPPYRRVHLKD